MTALPAWFPSGGIHRTLVFRIQTSHSALVREIGEDNFYELIDAVISVLQDEKRLT